MEGITEVRGNATTHPEFAKTLEKAKNAGVEILFLCCRVIPDEVFVDKVFVG
jgi:sugar fermentation stimulation protein A